MAKNKYVRYRLTESELNEIKLKASSFDSVSDFIRKAIKDFSNLDSNTKQNFEKELSIMYKKIDFELSHIGGNLNQAMKRANELYQAGLLSKEYLDSSVLPIIKESISLNLEIRKSLSSIMNTYVL